MRAFGWIRFFILAAILIAIPLIVGWDRVSEALLRDNLEIYSEFMSSPVNLVVPIFVVLIGCIPIYRDLGNRSIVNTRARVDIRQYVLINTAVGAGAAFLVLFLFAFLPFVLAFYIWPSIGNPYIDPSMYSMTADQAAREGATRITYSTLVYASPLGYAILYSAWVGFGGAVYVFAGVALLLILHNRVLAITLPFVVYLLETVAAALAGAPRFGLVYSLLPFGLTRAPAIEGAAATLFLLLVVGGTWVYLLNKMPHLDRLL